MAEQLGNLVKGDDISALHYEEVASATYNQTYATQLRQLQAAFNALTIDEKMNSVLLWANAVLIPINYNDGIYSRAVDQNDIQVMNITLKTHRRGGNDHSNENDTNPLRLMILRK